MSNITTDLQSFENIDYPKNIYELLLQLKNEPLQINCNGTSNPNTSGSYQKYNSEETLLREDPIFGPIYTKTFMKGEQFEFREDTMWNLPENFFINEDISELSINNIIDFSSKLRDVRKVSSDLVTRVLDINNLIVINSNNISFSTPILYDNNGSNSYIRILESFVTIVYTKYFKS